MRGSALNDVRAYSLLGQIVGSVRFRHKRFCRLELRQISTVSAPVSGLKFGRIPEYEGSGATRGADTYQNSIDGIVYKLKLKFRSPFFNKWTSIKGISIPAIASDFSSQNYKKEFPPGKRYQRSDNEKRMVSVLSKHRSKNHRSVFCCPLSKLWQCVLGCHTSNEMCLLWI